MAENFANFLFETGSIDKLQLSTLLEKHNKTNEKIGSIVYNESFLSKQEIISKLKDFSDPK